MSAILSRGDELIWRMGEYVWPFATDAFSALFSFFFSQVCCCCRCCCCRRLQWRHNERDGVSNHQPHECLLNCLFGRRSKKASKLRATGHCAGNSPATGEFPAQRASNAENVSIWWRHHHEIRAVRETPQANVMCLWWVSYRRTDYENMC